MSICDTGALASAVTCVPGVATSKFYYLDTMGCLVPGTRTDTTTCNPSVTTSVYTDAAGVVIPVVPKGEKVIYTVAATCGANTPAPPVAAPSTACGVDTTVQAKDLLSQTVHTAPGTALMVKMCPAASQFDREYSTLCAPDGTKVMVVTAWDTTAPLATAPTIETYKLDGSAYTGNRALLVDCAAEKLDIVTEEYCAAGVQYERISFYDVTVSPPVLASTLWRDSTGATVANPGVGTVGTCPAVVADRKVKIWYEQLAPGSTRSIAQISASTGTVHVQSVTVINVGTGIAKIIDDFGNTTPLLAGESFSWSAITGSDAFDTLGYSGLVIDASASTVHVTSTVIV